jgi:hypothetical protein
MGPPRRVAVRIVRDEIRAGRYAAVSFQRTLRIPDDGRTYPLPPGVGRFPVRRVRDFAARLPARWRERRGMFIPMYQREALWLAFEGLWWHPAALQVGVGGINALSGGPWDEGLSADPQNYLVVPAQPWLDGINIGGATIRQFVAMRLGLGYTVEEQLTGRAATGGIQIRVFEAKPGRFPTTPPRRASMPRDGAPMAGLQSMGLGAGGRMRQKVYPDPHGLATWKRAPACTVEVHVLNSEQFRAVTGEAMPPTPISAKTYSDHGFPWFELYDEKRAALPGSERLARVKTVRDLDARAGRPTSEESIAIAPEQVRRIRRRSQRR